MTAFIITSLFFERCGLLKTEKNHCGWVGLFAIGFPKLPLNASVRQKAYQ
jgi:hypothetical protein